MSPYEFARNDWPTVGVEIELQLVDAETMALRSAFDEVFARVPADLHGRVKRELMQCYLEINSEPCRTVADVGRDLAEKVAAVAGAAEGCGIRLGWAGTHPFSRWEDQQISPDPRYQGLVESLQETARRLVTFGLHVHVGVESGDKAVMVCDRIHRHLPTLLALSANSPFWNGRDTGLHSHRSKIMEGLPTAGLPPLMRNWSEYVWILNHLVATGFIKTIREIWWDVRPHHNFGTVEVRICDMPPDLDAVLALTALVQCLVYDLGREIDRGAYQYDSHPMLVRQNKWRACRFGLDAPMVEPFTEEMLPARQVARKLIGRLMPAAAELGCSAELEAALALADRPTGADLQRATFTRTADLAEVVRSFLR